MNERTYVRDLLAQVIAIASSARAQAALRRFRDVNELRKADRAPVWCRPVGCWDELLPETELVCSDPYIRSWERNFRRQLIKGSIGDDEIFLDYVPVEATINSEPANRWGVEIRHTRPAEKSGAWIYDPPIKESSDLDRLASPEFAFDQMSTKESEERASSLFDGIAPVRTECNPGFDHGTICSPAAELLGLEGLMTATVLEPELLHAVMARIRDAKMAQLDAIEATGLLVDNDDSVMVCHDPKPGPPALADTWTAGNSQEFDRISPAAFNEFLLEYQKPIFERFKWISYGCCESLNDKIDLVLTIPNLRVVVCSGWTDLDMMLSKTSPDKHCIMWRQKATDVVFAESHSDIKADLEEGCRKLQGRPYQIVLRELQTLRGNLDRLHVWADIAKGAAARFA